MRSSPLGQIRVEVFQNMVPSQIIQSLFSPIDQESRLFSLKTISENANMVVDLQDNIIENGEIPMTHSSPDITEIFAD
jgi:hypothetical protein